MNNYFCKNLYNLFYCKLNNVSDCKDTIIKDKEGVTYYTKHIFGGKYGILGMKNQNHVKTCIETTLNDYNNIVPIHNSLDIRDPANAPALV